ncbi:MAG TPA: Wzz/FepE/Etk N-terminal domain-containing protein, partial [Solimonas sp.]|nr:Wzz/FepE/Etk N-terminal domain-containing protein [Solimonas sp.]
MNSAVSSTPRRTSAPLASNPAGATFGVLWRARWPILALTVLAAIVGLVYCLSATPTYRATASLLIEPKEANVVEIDKVY